MNQYRGNLDVNTEQYHLSGFDYVLKTGASWHGPIGHARIVCDLGSIANYGPINFLPVGGRRKGRTITWDLYDFKPKEDVWIGWYKGFADISINGVSLWKQSDGKIMEGPNLEYIEAPASFKRGTEVWVPVRLAAQWLGAGLEGEPRENAVTLTRNGRRALATVGQATLETGQGALALPGRVFERNGAIFIPLQSLVKAFGGEAHFNPSGRLLVTLPETTDKKP